ncbi:MAG: NusA-like transcription termination signal-binding factor [Methanosarcinales archaeon]|nr:NusA-like transcription termination signal-binding factor [Methanosarcinales archaeon]HDJ38204.1 NusA-like transcription termination signal-binding factor [Methanosarcinales archaeon]
MGEIRLTTVGVRYIALFESLTGAVARDCIDDGDRVLYVVRNGDMGLAIGRNGEHINRVKKSIGKHIEIVEYSDNLSTFMKNVAQPAKVLGIELVVRGGRRIVYVDVPPNEKGLAIGRDGKNIEKMRMLAHRHHDVDDVIIR